MSEDKYEFADLSPVELKKIKQVEDQINSTEHEEVILLAYKKR